MAGLPDLSDPVVGQVAALRPAAERDIPEVLIAHQDDPSLAERLGLHRPPSGAELGRRVEASTAERAAGRELWLTILAVSAGTLADECCGQLELGEIDWENARAELSLWLAPFARGRGLGREALGLAGALLLGEAGLRRLALLAESDNAALRACALAAGFVPEGTLRAHRLGPRGRFDVSVFSLVWTDLGP